MLVPSITVRALARETIVLKGGGHWTGAFDLYQQERAKLSMRTWNS